jgi:DNA helicase II / ATP-dependent DNA helicase PcrA
MKSRIKVWLQSQKEVIEDLICKASDQFIEEKKTQRPSPNFLFDLKQSQNEAFALSQGKDWCYDRYTTGMFYALFYQGRRINTSLAYVIDMVVDASENRKPLEIFDLGAGTGAVQIAIGLCLQAIDETGGFIPAVRVINVDISPYMLDFNRSYLWKQFVLHYPAFKRIIPEFEVNSWTNPEEVKLITPYIIASYLFDHQENKNEVVAHFETIVALHKPEKLILITSNQQNKREFLNAVASKISGVKYQNQEVSNNFVFTGDMTRLDAYRRDFNTKHGTIFSLHNAPRWHEAGFYARCLTLTRSRLALSFEEESSSDEPIKMDLYLPPIKIRRNIRLNDQQKKAALLNNRPTIITGPAGCGKSVVITERIKNLCEVSNYSTDLKILLTTFNKTLIRYLADWLCDILDKDKFRFTTSDDEYFFYFNGSREYSIRLMHFDILPTRISRHTNMLRYDEDHKIYLQESARLVCLEMNIDAESFADILNPSFLLDEYVRVIYGQQYDSLAKYQEGKRSGRPYKLDHNSDKRALIWKVIHHYLAFMQEEKIESIHTRRHKLLQNLRGGTHRGIFTHIFVDEFQDCTQADYQIFYGLLADNNQLVIAGDYAQAVHIGKTASAPREDEIFQGAQKMNNREIKRLDGSYRLPFRISECIKPLSVFIKGSEKDTDIITPYKGAPPGARPIVVYAKSTEEMKDKLLWIFWHYQIFDIYSLEDASHKKITVLELDKDLSWALNTRVPGIATTDTILKLKGMEKDCIVWSTRKKIEDVDDVYFYIYTILTRTCSILIIALYDDTPTYTYEALSKLNPERLLLWDQESVTHFDNNVINLMARNQADVPRVVVVGV